MKNKHGLEKAEDMYKHVAGPMPNGHDFQHKIAGAPINGEHAKERAKKVVGI